MESLLEALRMDGGATSGPIILGIDKTKDRPGLVDPLAYYPARST